MHRLSGHIAAEHQCESIFSMRDQFHSLSSKLQRNMTNIPIIKYLLDILSLCFLLLFPRILLSSHFRFTELLSTWPVWPSHSFFPVACDDLYIVYEGCFALAFICFGNKRNAQSTNKHIKDQLFKGILLLLHEPRAFLTVRFFFCSSGQLYICSARHPEKSQGPGGAGQQDWWWVICLTFIHPFIQPSIKHFLFTALLFWLNFHLPVPAFLIV